ncbi:MAG: HNH endonuclease signature motif containing protein [Candidatus Methylomirabilales bacterium]
MRYRDFVKQWRPDADPDRYIRWRRAVFRACGCVCAKCGKTGKRKELHADHIKTWLTHPELRYEVSNGRVLCRDCHAKRHGKGIPEPTREKLRQQRSGERAASAYRITRELERNDLLLSRRARRLSKRLSRGTEGVQ